MKTLLGLCVLLCCANCAPSLQRVAAERPSELGAGEQDPKRCAKLSRFESRLRYTSAGSAALAGGSGLATMPVEDPEARRALAITAASFGVMAVTSEAIRGELAADFARECE